MLTVCLASKSPQRLSLLRQIGVEPMVSPVEIDEAVHPKEEARPYVSRMAKTKAARIVQCQSFSEPVVVIAADTAVVCGRQILTKPSTAEEARTMLERLSGRRHRVYSAVVTYCQTWRIRQVISFVTFKRLSSQDIESHLNSQEWRERAGGYAIQGLAGGWVRSLSGSYSGVVGLPLFETRQLLLASGWKP